MSSRVISAPLHTFKCLVCNAVCEADLKDFRERHTMPPTYVVNCGFCHNDTVCSPPSILAIAVGRISSEQALAFMTSRYKFFS